MMRLTVRIGAVLMIGAACLVLTRSADAQVYRVGRYSVRSAAVGYYHGSYGYHGHRVYRSTSRLPLSAAHRVSVYGPYVRSAYRPQVVYKKRAYYRVPKRIRYRRF